MDLPTIALVTEPRYVDRPQSGNDWYLQNIFLEDRLLSTALRGLGFNTIRVDWSDQEVDWGTFEGVLLRSTWDYFHRLESFRSWLEARRLDSRLINPYALLHWNIDKHYLMDLDRKGITIVPTLLLEQGSPIDTDSIFDWIDEDEAVLKPCVSGAARHTYRLRKGDHEAWGSILHKLLPHESMMVQPFQKRILEEGEITLVAMNGRVTHAVRKRAKPGDFRVQDDHGGKVEPHQPSSEQIAFAEQTIAACPSLPIYARVDIVLGKSEQWQLMELELIEPELWMRFHPASAEAFASSVHTFLDSNRKES